MPERAGERQFIRNTAQVFGGQVAMMVVGMANGVLTARMLGPHDRGLFQLLVLLPTMLANFAKLGIPQASVYFMRRRGASASDVASNAVWFALVLGGGLAAVCWGWRDWLLARVLKDAPVAVLPVILAIIPGVLLQTYLLGVAQAQERFSEYNIRQIVPNVLAFVGLVLTLVVLRLGLIGAVLTHVTIVAFMTAWLTARVHREAPLHLAVNAPLARGMLRFGGKSYVQTLAATLHLRLDQYLVAYLLDPGQVGLYAVAVNFTNLLARIPDATGTVLFPRLAGTSERGAHTATARVCRHTLFLTGAGAVVVCALGPFAIPLLYGHRFAGAVVPMLILLPGILMVALYQILTRNFTSRGRQEVNIAAALLALGLNVGLNVALLPRLGLAGAALAHGISYGAAAVVLLVAFVRRSGHSVRDTLLLQSGELRELVRLGWRSLRPPARADR
jgi:O-antigen/teichoic acid export membrane protein